MLGLVFLLHFASVSVGGKKTGEFCYEEDASGPCHRLFTYWL